MSRPPHIIRDYVHATDAPIVFSSWCKHIRTLPPFSSFDGPTFARHKQLLERLVGRAGVRVCCHPEYPGQIYGWCCSEQRIEPDESTTPVLHFLYVRKTWRRNGYATQLMMDSFIPWLGETAIHVSHPARSMRYHAERWNLIYNPYVVEQSL